jgi:hypothetical protein
MAIANTGVKDIAAFYGDTTSCTKFLMSPADFAEAKRAPDSAKWALSAQSGTLIDKSVAVANPMMGDPGLSTAGVLDANGNRLEASYAVNSPARQRVYPGP